MRNTNLIILWLKKVYMLFAGILFCIFMSYSCAHKKPDLSVAFYYFDYNGENYRIRSISSKDKALSCNELIGGKFLAKDYDQDRFIDEITLGDISLSEAQKIYECALTMLTMENKLHEVTPKVNRYQHVNFKYNYEIKSFRPNNANPFNEFRIINNRQLVNPQIIISIDKNANGTLDKIVEGTMLLEKIQTKYSDVIKKGLKNNKLIEIDNMILVKEK